MQPALLALVVQIFAADGDLPATGVPGSVTWGGAGVHRVLAAHPALYPGLAASLGGDLAVAHSFLAPGDTAQLQGQSLHVMWAPLGGLELGLSVGTLNIVDNKYPDGGAQSLGNPAVNAKYSAYLAPGVGLGGALRVSVPIAAGGSGLAFDNLVLTGLALATFAPLAALEFSLNAGYTYDRSAAAISGPTNAAQLLAIGAVSTNRLAGGVGVSSHVELLDTLSLGPFGELAVEYAPHVPLAYNPLRATVGLKLFVLKTRAFELGAGVDLRLAGAPNAASPYPGIPPWLAFGQVTVHAFAAPEPPPSLAAPPVIVAPPPCQDSNACPAGLACDANQCVRLVQREVIREVPRDVVHESTAPPPTFVLTGTVVDDEGKPLPEASIRLSGYDGVQFGVDAHTGIFKSTPLPVGAGAVQVTASAPGFNAHQEVVPRGAANATVRVAFTLHDVGAVQTGVVKGTVRDGRTGLALDLARVLIPVLGPKPIKVDGEAGFNLQVKPGHYQMLVFAPKHVTQRKKLTVRAGDVLIVNVDLQPAAGGGRHGR